MVVASRFVVLAFASAFAALPALADPGQSALRVVRHIAGPDGRWDYASFDPARHRLYVAHGGAVMMVDVGSGQVTPTFAAGDGLHSALPIPGTDLILTTNGGDSSARLISAMDGKLMATLPTAKDPDAAIYDPGTGQAIVVGGDSGVLTLIDPKVAKIEGTIELDPGLEFASLDGHGRLFVNNSDKNEIEVVDLAARRLVARYHLAGCHGVTGLAYVEGGRLVSACVNGLAKIVDAASGREIASLAIGKGADAVLYDPGRHLAYVPCSADGTLAVVALAGAGDNALLDTVPTQLGARTGAVDPTTGDIYLPTAQFGPPVPPATRRTLKPGSFEILVLGRQ
jgi:DNA-binding beta-propeller fold protein YncE